MFSVDPQPQEEATRGWGVSRFTLQGLWLTATQEAQSEHPQSSQVCRLRLHHWGHYRFSQAHSPAQVWRLVLPVSGVRPLLYIPPLAGPTPLHRPSAEGAAGSRPIQRAGQRRWRESKREPVRCYRWEWWRDTKYQMQSVWEAIWNGGTSEYAYEDTWDGIYKIKETKCCWEMRGKLF